MLATIRANTSIYNVLVPIVSLIDDLLFHETLSVFQFMLIFKLQILTTTFAFIFLESTSTESSPRPS